MHQKYAEWAKMFRWYYKAFALDVAKYINAGRILDVGCGPGVFMEELSNVFKNAEVYGIDLDMNFCKISRVVCGDARSLPFKNHTFDLITLTYSLHDAGFTSLFEAKRCLKKGGVLAIKDINSEMQPNVKSMLLANLERNVGKEYAERIEKIIRSFPSPDFVAKFVGELFEIHHYRKLLVDFEIIAVVP